MQLDTSLASAFPARPADFGGGVRRPPFLWLGCRWRCVLSLEAVVPALSVGDVISPGIHYLNAFICLDRKKTKQKPKLTIQMVRVSVFLFQCGLFVCIKLGSFKEEILIGYLVLRQNKCITVSFNILIFTVAVFMLYHFPEQGSHQIY